MPNPQSSKDAITGACFVLVVLVLAGGWIWYRSSPGQGDANPGLVSQTAVPEDVASYTIVFEKDQSEGAYVRKRLVIVVPRNLSRDDLTATLRKAGQDEIHREHPDDFVIFADAQGTDTAGNSPYSAGRVEYGAGGQYAGESLGSTAEPSMKIEPADDYFTLDKPPAPYKKTGVGFLDDAHAAQAAVDVKMPEEQRRDAFLQFSRMSDADQAAGQRRYPDPDYDNTSRGGAMAEDARQSRYIDALDARNERRLARRLRITTAELDAIVSEGEINHWPQQSSEP